MKSSDVREVMRKLADYEDLEEKGLKKIGVCRMTDSNTKKHISEILDFIKVKIDMLEEELLAHPININNLDEIIENGNKAVRIDELKRVFEFIKRCTE